MEFIWLSVAFLITFFSLVAVDLRHAKKEREKERKNG